MVFLLYGFQGSPLLGSGVARQGLCDDNDNGLRDLEERSYMKVKQSCHHQLHHIFVFTQSDTCTLFGYQSSTMNTENTKGF